jgi:hypothetical protein
MQSALQCRVNCAAVLALPLLMLLDNTDNAHDAVALYYLAFVTDFFNRCSDFHLYSTPRLGPGPISFAPPRAHIIYIDTKCVPVSGRKVKLHTLPGHQEES